ncbi:molybdate ABC transporter substrate-binding protein [Oceanobacillus neutriphilus]|uniref:Molybdate ABC transporter substrate-binding protein n=1 Tax=Oceanobacillus neutriphilus TaxID=531815 RepID=A0ABQ2P1S0_9BACI|nr:molybdate ABC transporter substrate-binding protein [Oceanobacillus neutriphilus]GGP15839.1 molybdate ABC transporter substrate-binding protein [Oceanobacillus neutriphilus]
MKKYYMFICIFILFLFAAGCSKNNADEVDLNISAAASMTESLTELTEMFEEEHPNIHISYNYGGSGSLRQQIEQGAPVDIFLSASSIDYDKLADQDMVDEGKAILTNQLVLIKSNKEDIESLDDFMAGEDKVMAVGTPEAVPAGSYAKEALQELGVWEQLDKQSRLVYTKDVTHVLTLVKEDAADAGLVYASDVIDEDGVTVIQTFDSNLHSPIEYYIATLQNEDQEEEVQQAKDAYYQFISSETANEVFENYGFQPVK